MRFVPDTSCVASEAQIRSAIENFEALKNSGPHGPDSTVLPFILNHCKSNRMSYQLTYYGGGGYFVQRLFPI